jgi:hypothetical protein
MGTIRQAPDLYLNELCEILAMTCGVNVSDSTVWRTLKEAGFTMKKVCIHLILVSVFQSVWQVTRIAVERSAAKRLDYVSRIGMYEVNQLVFVDESSVDRRTTYRGYAWSIRGTHAQRKAFFVRGRRYVELTLPS